MEKGVSKKLSFNTSFCASILKTKASKPNHVKSHGCVPKYNQDLAAQISTSQQMQQAVKENFKEDRYIIQVSCHNKDIETSPSKKTKFNDNVKLCFAESNKATTEYLKDGMENSLDASLGDDGVIEDNDDETILETDVGDLCETILEEVSNTDVQNDLTENTIADHDLDNDIYQHQEIIQFIWQSVAGDPCRKKLLSPADFCILNTLFNLPDYGQEVLFRLYTRQKKWYQLDKFLKTIKLDHNKALDLTLIDMHKFGYISLDIHHKNGLQDTLNFLTMPDLRKLVKEFRVKCAKNAKRDNLVSALSNFAQSQRTLSSISLSDRVKAAAIKVLGKCIRLADSLRVTLFRLHLAYHYELTELTSTHEVYLYIHDVRSGRTVLPKFTVKDHNAFDNWKEFYKYADAISFYFEYQTLKKRPKSKVQDKLLEIANKVYDKLQDPTVYDNRLKFTPAYVYAKILSIAVIDLTKEQEQVLTWLDFLLDHEYCSSKCGEWYVEMAKHYRAQHNFEATIEACQAGLADDRVNNIDKYNLLQRLHELKKRKKINNENEIPALLAIKDIPVTTTAARPLEGTKTGNRVLYKDDDALQTVEKIAANYYTSLYPRWIHCEGSLVTTLFTIFFWDIIYKDIDNAFTNSMQYIPLDMFSKDFYLNRMEVITTRIENIGVGWTDEYLFDYLNHWKIEHAHEKGLHSMELVNSFQLIIDCVKCITRIKLAIIFTRFVKNIKLYKAGMPDLFLWHPSDKRCLFVEVKSQNDKLSMKQKDWLCFLHDNGVHVEICLVNSVGARKYRTTAK